MFATPRRLAVRLGRVAGRQEDRTLEVAGPPVKAAFKEGKPTKAAEGFARGQGVSVEDLVRRETPKGEYLYAVVHQPGRAAAELLPGAVERALKGVAFKRSMRWGASEATFARPVVWLSASHAGRVLPARFAGVEAGGESRGHRFLAPEPFSVTDDVFAYVARLEARRVVADPARRREMILERARELAREAGGELLAHEALLDEVTQLVELPVPLLGRFDPRFLEVPKEVLVSEMEAHQRYFPVVGADGALLPYFVVVAGTEVEDAARSLAGYRRVLSARFSDGAFFFAEDQKRPLIDRLEDLAAVRFHRDLGSVRDKVERFSRLAFRLASELAEPLGLSAPLAPPPDPLAAAVEGKDGFAGQLARAGALAKADLTTQMVYEFPELQGVMGAEYARRGGEPEAIARAIAEHYLPRGADDDLPSEPLGALVGLADRFDTLAGIFANGKGPSGTADPFGLRRAALGVIRVLRARGWHLSLDRVLGAAVDELGAARRKKPAAQVVAEVKAFFRARLKAALVGEGVPTDVAEAVLEADHDDVVDAADRARALAELRASADFEPIAVTFKRVANILKGAAPPAPDRESLDAAAEVKLHDAARAVEARVAEAARARSFGAAFGVIADLAPVVDAFFEDVLVMAEDPAVRARRQGLLALAHRTFAPLADFTKLS
jgi:glycyl-tRNA synthetase beta chain